MCVPVDACPWDCLFAFYVARSGESVLQKSELPRRTSMSESRGNESLWEPMESNTSVAADDPWSWWSSWWAALDPVTYNVVVYAIIIGGLVLSSMARTVAFFVMCMRASVNLHNRMFRSVIRAPIYFFDTNPIGEFRRTSLQSHSKRGFSPAVHRYAARCRDRTSA